MVTVAVGTTNDDKIQATRQVFSEYFDEVNVKNFKVMLRRDGPIKYDDIFNGAEYRAKDVTKKDPNADFYVGIEGGLIKYFGRHFRLDCVFIMKEKGKGNFGIAPSFELPPAIAEEILGGKRLKEVVDRLSGTKNGSNLGVLNYLSEGRIDYVQQLTEGVRMALLPMLNERVFYSRQLPIMNVMPK